MVGSDNAWGDAWCLRLGSAGVVIGAARADGRAAQTAEILGDGGGVEGCGAGAHTEERKIQAGRRGDLTAGNRTGGGREAEAGGYGTLI